MTMVTKSVPAKLAIAGACLFTIAACSRTPAPEMPAALAQQSSSVYRLGLGDKLRVYVFGEKDLSGQFQVSSKGTIAMPLIGEVPAAGLTARELQAALTERFSQGYLRHPDVTVEVYDFRPYFVLGEVARPGQFPTQEGLTLIGAIASAGGFTYRANQKSIFLRRAGSNREYRVDPNAPIIIAPGDVIRVGERYF
jgi:polysaccharide export outer membrane protein